MVNKVELLETATSTNLYLQNLSNTTFTGCGKAVATFNQTEGKGQRGNSWLSEPAKNIQYSLLYRPKDITASNQFLISQAVSLSLRAILAEYNPSITIKWPNDIYWKNKKMAGILIENTLTGATIDQSIIGIGVNVNQTTFPPELPDATSLSLITGTSFNLPVLVDKIHESLCKGLSELTMDKATDIQRFYINNLYRRDGFHPYADQGGTFNARLRGIGPKGNLLLEDETGTVRSYDFKEVQFR